MMRLVGIDRPLAEQRVADMDDESAVLSSLQRWMLVVDGCCAWARLIRINSWFDVVGEAPDGVANLILAGTHGLGPQVDGDQ
ncbi:hypothetical protein CCR82_01895 [Halochromatium salexigens]|uniref:Uncharacterized protein n=1 Tax=Halochromatium salexigens TaxID=49447 RepID=A0AAJ0UDG0_HALSE|nr:hypothetical protein [Halochromatium salexigens]